MTPAGATRADEATRATTTRGASDPGPDDVAALPVEEVEAFPPLAEVEHGCIYALSLTTDTAPLTHGLHRFPAKFVPQVPAWALEAFAGPATTTLDPFCGSGTTLVEGVVRGGTTLGAEIDPLAALVARAKVAPADPDRIAVLGERLRRRWTAPTPPDRLEVPMAGVERFEHWFTPEAWGWVQSLRHELCRLDADEHERTFLLAVLSSILRRVSNADDQSHKTYVSGTLPKRPPPVPDTFWRAFARAHAGLTDLTALRRPGAIARVLDGADATDLGLADASVDLVVTSPPYLDSVDYAYNLMVEHFWLGPLLGVPDRAELNRRRRLPVGAKHPRRPAELPTALDGLVRAEHLPAARWRATTAYFSLLAASLDEAARVLRPGGHAVLVVGNSQSRTAPVPVHEAVVRLAAGAGLHLELGFGYRIRRHHMRFPRAGRGGIILLDWVLVLRRGHPGPRPDPLPLPWVTLDPAAVAH